MNDALVSFLKATIPFSLLPPRLLGKEGDHLFARNLAAGEEILTAGASPDAACVVRSGSLEATYAQCLPLTLTPGDMLGCEAALPMGQGADMGLWEARAAEPSEVILIPLDSLARLMSDELFARALAARAGGLAAATERARSQACQPGPDPFLRLRVGDMICPAPVFVESSLSVAGAARVMTQTGATSALVRGQGEVLGILTERDVLSKVVAAGQDAETLPVTAVMTPGLVTVGPAELLIEAFSRMVHHGIRRLVLLDESGAPAGVLGERDMLSARGESPLALASEILVATAPRDLARTFERLHRMAGRSVAEGISSDAVGRLISEMHDRIMTRAWEMALLELGPAPAPHAVLVLGSQGRREQFLATDQDLALVYEGGKGSGPELESWFERLGVRLTEMLLELGFPPCKNRIMLDNPDWRRSLDSWLDLFDSMADRPDAEAVIKTSLLADMRPFQVQGAGSCGLNVRLREAMTRRLRKSPILLKLMAREAVRFSPPLGLFGTFSLKKDEEGRGCLDIKRGGVFPITQGVKTLAVDHGLAETGTCARLRLLHRSGALSVPLAEGLCDAYDFLQTLRMRAQASHLRQGRPLDNDIRPDTLGAMERERLRASFKLTAEFQNLLFEKYGLRMLG
ncbi:MAG: CBS domain-containing protein [Proteobacteria bacterium]|nr:CBS domain-containing protein [Pseudomonadota bacterium]MBU1595205.1 CBS domain-containing protein [Pseudomonadota bacterium]